MPKLLDRKPQVLDPRELIDQHAEFSEARAKRQELEDEKGLLLNRKRALDSEYRTRRNEGGPTQLEREAQAKIDGTEPDESIKSLREQVAEADRELKVLDAAIKLQRSEVDRLCHEATIETCDALEGEYRKHAEAVVGAVRPLIAALVESRNFFEACENSGMESWQSHIRPFTAYAGELDPQQQSLVRLLDMVSTFADIKLTAAERTYLDTHRTGPKF